MGDGSWVWKGRGKEGRELKGAGVDAKSFLLQPGQTLAQVQNQTLLICFKLLPSNFKLEDSAQGNLQPLHPAPHSQSSTFCVILLIPGRTPRES